MAYSALIFCLTESPLVEKARTPGKWSVYFAPFPASNMIYFDSIMTPLKITLSTARCRSPAGICSRGHKSRESGPYLRAWSGGGDSRSWSPSPEQLHSSNSSQRTHAHTHTYTPNHEFFLIHCSAVVKHMVLSDFFHIKSHVGLQYCHLTVLIGIWTLMVGLSCALIRPTYCNIKHNTVSLVNSLTLPCKHTRTDF